MCRCKVRVIANFIVSSLMNDIHVVGCLAYLDVLLSRTTLKLSMYTTEERSHYTGALSESSGGILYIASVRHSMYVELHALDNSVYH